MTQFYFNPIGGYWLVAGVAAVLLLLLLVGPDAARLSSKQRWALIGLRAGVIGLILVAMLRPARVVTEVSKQSATLVVLVDRSRSMQVADAIGGESRWQALREVLADAQPMLGELAKDLEIEVFAFDANLDSVEFEPGDLQLGDEPKGEQSAIGAALEDVLRREAGKRVVGVLLLSDGAQRAYAPNDAPPQTAARRLADLGYPLYTFAFGQARGLGQARDVAMKDMLASPTVFVKNQLAVSGSLLVDGYAGKPIRVQLLFETKPGKMEVVAAQEVEAAGDGQQVPINLGYVPQTPGEFKVTLRAESQDGELVTTNNELSTFVTVRKGGLNVLYLEGAPRVEQRFLRHSVGASPDIQLDYELISSRGRDQWPVQIGDRFDPGKYDVYIIGDLDSSALSDADWKKLADRVEQGAGLMMLGGFHSFGPGGYQRTALGDVLPVEMGRFERQNFGEPISKDLHVAGPLKMTPTEPLGARHSILRLAPGAENAQTWSELPPLEGANRFSGVKRLATVLADAGPPSNQPLLVAGGYGNGRTLAFAADSTWHWVMEGFEKPHKRFWRQVILWLAKKDEATDGNVWVRLDARRYLPGGRVRFEVGADSPHGEPLPNATFEVAVVLPDGTRQPVGVARRGEEGQAVGYFLDTQQSGDYAVEVVARQDGAPLGEAKARFLVTAQDLELDNPAADPDLLASLAQTTSAAGGKALAAEELPTLLQELQKQPMELEVENQVKHTYWDTWTLFLLFVALVSGEWFLRKKWGLV